MTTRLKLGLVGLGAVAERYHVPAIRAVPEVQAWMAVDLDIERARQVGSLAPFEHVTTKLDDLDNNVDLAIVALPNGAHQPVACQLLEAGIHVLCEKPMARTVAECRAMIASAERSGARLCIGQNRRFRTNVVEAKRLIDAGLLGQINHIEAEEGGTSDWQRSAAYFDPTLAGGGALLDVGIHAIDLIRFLVGEFDEVVYEGNQTSQTVESHAVVRFKLATGAVGSITSSRVQDLRQRIILRGDEGELTIGLWGSSLMLSRTSGKAFERFKQLTLNPVRRAMDASFVEQLTQFVRAITSGGPVPITGKDGLNTVEVVERAYCRLHKEELSITAVHSSANGESYSRRRAGVSAE